MTDVADTCSISAGLSFLHSPERTSVWIDEHYTLPLGGRGYIARPTALEAKASNNATTLDSPAAKDGSHITHYVDNFGRIFTCSNALSIPPAKEAALVLDPPPSRDEHDQACAGQDRHEGLIYIREQDGSLHACGSYYEEKGQFGYKNFHYHSGLVQHKLSYQELMHQCYTEFIHIPRLHHLELRHIGPKAVYDILEHNDLFTALQLIVDRADTLDASFAEGITGVERWLARMIGETGLVGKGPEDLRFNDLALTPELLEGLPDPQIRLITKQAHSKNFYISFDRTLVSSEGHAALLACEGVLNRYRMLVEFLEERTDILLQADEGFCDTAIRLIETESLVDQIDTQFGQDAAEETEEKRALSAPSEAMARILFASSCEQMESSWRFDYRFRMVLKKRSMCIELICPQQTSVCTSYYNEDMDLWLAADDDYRYYERLRMISLVNWYMTAHAFQTNPLLDELYINGVDAEEDTTCIFSYAMSRKDYISLLAEAPRNTQGQLLDPKHVALALFDQGCGGLIADKHLDADPIQPRVGLRDREFVTAACQHEPDHDARPIPAEAQEYFAAERVKDMRCNFGNTYHSYAQHLSSLLVLKDTPAAIRYVRDVHDKTEDVLLRRACDRALELILSSEGSKHLYADLDRFFRDPIDLEKCFAEATALPPEKQEEQIALLRTIIRNAQGWFPPHDGKHVTWRIFANQAQRSLYVRDFYDGRKLYVLPNEYYYALSMAASLLRDSFSDHDEALSYAQELVRIAPTDPSSYLTLSHCYFTAGDYKRSLELVRTALPYCTLQKEIGIILHHAAHCWWKLGEHQACTCALFQAGMYHPVLRSVIQQELHAMLDDAQHLREMSPEEDRAYLAEMGLDLSILHSTHEYLLRASNAAANMNSFRLAFEFMYYALELNYDDMYLPIMDSYAG